MFDQVVVQLAALVGFAAFVSVLVNVLKFFGVVQDGTADKWVAGLNLVGVLALYVLRQFFPGVPIEGIDATLLEISKIGGYLMGFVTMIFGSKITYAAVAGLPVIGKSFSAEEE